MSKFTILKGDVPLINESGAVDFNTDWQEIERNPDGRKMTLSAHFPNTLSQVETIILEVSNTGVDAAAGQEVDLVTATTNDGISEEINYKFARFRYKIVGAVPTGVVSSIPTELT